MKNFKLVIFILWVWISPVSAWEGFEWETWREITDAQSVVAESPQAGLSTLFPLLSTDDPSSPDIDSIKQWEEKRDRIVKVLQQFIGQPESLQPLPSLARMVKEEDCGTYHRRHIRIRSEKDDWIPAYLLIPKSLPAFPSPAMIVLHQTVAQGKDEPAGIEGNPKMAFALELVQRGYICIVPDMIGFGERIPFGEQPYHGAHDFYRKHPKWSFFGKMIWDVQRIVDYLLTLPEIDPYCIGSIGHSHGAYGTILCTIFEPRISAAVVSCGFTTLRSDPSPNRWSHLTALLPSLGFHVDDVSQIPFDWHEIIACIAPRPYFNWATLDDKIFPNTENLNEIFGQLEGVYSLYGAKDFVQSHLVPGDHAFPKEGQELAYKFLDQHLDPGLVLAYDDNIQKKSLETWEKHCRDIREMLIHDIGPVDPPRLSTDYEVLNTLARDGYLEKKIEYFVARDEPITAYLLIPDQLEDENPAMIVFHQTTEFGKEEAVGHKGRESIHFGPELAKRGYIVLAPDSICAGERITEAGAFDTRDFYQRYSTYSAMGKMIQDGRRAIDMLQSLKEVDPNRIGAIGHSLGAEEAMFVAAFDERIQAAAASCGWAPFAVESNPERWARDHWFSYMPKLRIDLRAGRLPAWDFDDVICLIAPRGYFNYQTEDDTIFPEGDAAHEMTMSLLPIWVWFNAEENLRSILEPGPHDIQDGAKSQIYQWLDRILNN